MLLLAVLLVALPPTNRPAPSHAADDSARTRSTQEHYAQKDIAALKVLLQRAGTRAGRLLCQYRLYPLTEDDRYLNDLPDELEGDATARELALLSGLWGYRAARASLFGALRAGRHSMQLLKAARARDPDDPFVLLIEGQSLLFRPVLAGGSDKEALQRFRRLRTVLDGRPEPAISPTEAALWTWYALRQTDHAHQADLLYQDLSARDLPSLYREFLNHPPGT